MCKQHGTHNTTQEILVIFVLPCIVVYELVQASSWYEFLPNIL
jgi:hypothetical protein